MIIFSEYVTTEVSTSRVYEGVLFKSTCCSWVWSENKNFHNFVLYNSMFQWKQYMKTSSSQWFVQKAKVFIHKFICFYCLELKEKNIPQVQKLLKSCRNYTCKPGYLQSHTTGKRETYMCHSTILKYLPHHLRRVSLVLTLLSHAFPYVQL